MGSAIRRSRDRSGYGSAVARGGVVVLVLVVLLASIPVPAVLKRLFIVWHGIIMDQFDRLIADKHWRSTVFLQQAPLLQGQ